MNPVTVLLLASSLLQLAAAVQAVRLIRVTGRKRAWVLISIALVLMAARRLLSLAGVSVLPAALAVGDVVAETVALATSALLLAGVSLIGWVFRQAHADQVAVDRLSATLRAKEDQQRLLVDQLPIGVVVVVDGRVAFVNRAFCEIFGIATADALGEPLEGFFLAEQRDELRQWLENLEVLGTGSYGRSEWRALRSNGGERWMTVRGLRTRWEGGPGLIVTVADSTQWKLATARLEESEARFRALTEAAGCAIIVVQKDSFRYVNSAAEAMVGYRSDELRLMAAWDLIHPDDREMVRERGYARARGKAPPPRYQFRIIRKDGQERWLDFTADRIHYDGEPALLGTAFDITEHKLAEEELRSHRLHLEELVEERTRLLRDSEETFRALAESSTDVIMRFDRELRHLYANPAVEPQTNIPASEFVGKTHAELGFPSDLVALWEESLREVFETARPKRIEFELPSRIWIDWLLIPEFSQDGEVTTVVTTARDITERKRAEEELRRHRDDLEELIGERTSELRQANELLQSEVEERSRVERALRESEERFRSLYDNVTIGLYRTTPAGDIVLANPAMMRIVGYSSFEELSSRNLESDPVYLDSTRGEFKALVEERGQVQGLESTWLRKDGSRVVVRESARAVRDQAGQVLWYEGTVEDISEQRALEEQLRQAQRLEALGQLAGGVAHDFNNILMAVLGSVELLGRRIPGDDAGQRECGIIHRSVTRGSELTRGLLAFARRQVLEQVDLDLGEVVHDLLPMLRRVIPENIAIELQPGEEVGSVRADRGNIDQVIVNLCVNARDAMPAGGRIIIETEDVQVDADFLATHPWAKEGRYALLSISDSGVGMDRETLVRIFDPFFTTKAPGSGTGMGLATVYGIVKQHEGMIRAYSEPGTGSTFRIYLPVGQTRPTEAPGRSEGPVVGGCETVLVAEDEDEVRHILVEVLTGLGYRVLDAVDGEEAVGILRREGATVDLVLTDVVMPRMGGEDLWEAAQTLAPDARFLFSSGYAPGAVDERLLDREGVSYIAKPYGIDTLARKVREVLDGGCEDPSGEPDAPVG